MYRLYVRQFEIVRRRCRNLLGGMNHDDTGSRQTEKEKAVETAFPRVTS
jgi:hypothetical protein